MVLQLVGDRLTDSGLRVLREHVRQLHPHAGLGPDADAGEVLHHYDVEPIT